MPIPHNPLQPFPLLLSFLFLLILFPTIHSQQPTPCSLPTIISPTTIQLGNCNNRYYILPLSLGTPPQQINCIISTQSSYLWVLQQSDGMGYDYQMSSTAKMTDLVINQPIQVFDDAIVSGKVVFDVVDMGAVNITNPIAVIYYNNTNPYNISNVYGIIGLNNQHPNLFSTATNAHQLTTPSFTLNLQPTPLSSYFYYNQPLPISNVIYQPIYSNNMAQLQIIGLTISNQNTDNTPSFAILSTTIAYFNVSPHLYKQFVYKYFNKTNNICLCSQCNELWPNIQIMFSNVLIKIPPQAYIYEKSENQEGICTFGFGVIENEEFYDSVVLGLALFRRYNVSFNMEGKEVGFQGDTEEVRAIQGGFLQAGMYVMVSSMGVISVIALGMLWKFRVIKQEQIKRYSEITLSSRFLDPS